jgi:hypothetical protein
MPVNTDQVVQILPLPDDTPMSSNKQVITGIDDRGIVKYTPNGTYEITASSYASESTKPYVIANATEDYWECDFKDNPNSKYKQNPYTESTGKILSSYQGGGTDYLWTTPVGSSKIINVRGEWIQLHIPYKAYIQRYGIRTPTYTQFNTFPRNFMLVASNDGNAWIQLDQRNLKETDMPTGAIITKSFDINSPEKYSYFRLIVMGMGPGIKTLKINELIMFGTTMISTNENALKPEPFVTLSRSFELKDAAKSNAMYDGINTYDRQYGKYSLDANVSSVNTPTANDDNVDTEINNITVLEYALKTSILAGILLTSVFFYKIIRR